MTKKTLLEPAQLISAYTQGFFPMADFNEQIRWYSPESRAIFPLYDLKPPRSLVKFIQKNNLQFTINMDFEFVITNCANREVTWISNTIIESYIKLHKLGYAHSVEVWLGDEIVGGLYGVSISAAFFGESMFNLISNASKSAFYFLVSYLKKKEFVLLDSQFINDFTAQLGAIEIPRDQYLHLLQIALNKECYFID